MQTYYLTLGKTIARPLVGLALGLWCTIPSYAATPSPTEALATLRQACVAAAADLAERERAVVTLEHDIGLLGRDAEARQRGLDDSHAEQGQLLAALELVALYPPDQTRSDLINPVDQRRREMLIDGTLPALRAEARALSAEFERIGQLQQSIAAKQAELPTAQAAMPPARERVVQLVAQRQQLVRKLLPEDSEADARAARLGREASDPADLIKRADAAINKRDKELLASAVAAAPKNKPAVGGLDSLDPTRPSEQRHFDPPQTQLVPPAIGTVLRRFGEEGTPPAASEGLWLAGLPGGDVVAPFDGRVVYAGPYGNLGLVLIIRHGDGYHSLLAALGRVDVTVGQWVLGGEPVGAMPDPAGTLYVEMRRDGRPVDPQPWLAIRDEPRDSKTGTKKVSE